LDTGRVTPAVIFRGTTPGDLAGPHISQFLYKQVPYGMLTIEQKYLTHPPGSDRVTAYDAWLGVQIGAGADSPVPILSDTRRFISNGRDLARYVHDDFTYQPFLNAALYLSGLGVAALSETNPYRRARREAGFVTFGVPMILDLVTAAAQRALKAAWYQKWNVHRRLRPEAFGGRVHNHLRGVKEYDLNAQVLGSAGAARVREVHGTHLLPMAYAEGSPAHPAYPAGHAAIGGACATILKAMFDERFPIPAPAQAAADGAALHRYEGAELTIGSELNKLASNISFGRNFAGIHWRSDAAEGLRLGEEVALGILRDFVVCQVEEAFEGWRLTLFDGSAVFLPAAVARSR
jgi:hypothetical protein